jgi:hypothetical protein
MAVVVVDQIRGTGADRPAIGETIFPDLEKLWHRLADDHSQRLSKASINAVISIMICRSCLRAAARNRIGDAIPSKTTRFLSTSTPLRNATSINNSSAPAPRQGSPTDARTPAAATSTSAAQPFSEPLTPSAKKEQPKQSPVIRSSVPAGTPLKGLNFLKNQQDPVAMEDHEYPSWLWDILKAQEKKGEAAAEGDLFCTRILSLSSDSGCTYSSGNLLMAV